MQGGGQVGVIRGHSSSTVDTLPANISTRKYFRSRQGFLLSFYGKDLVSYQVGRPAFLVTKPLEQYLNAKQIIFLRFPG